LLGTGLSSVAVHADPVAGAYLNVPWAVGGERIEVDGSRGWYAGQWPTIPVAGLRIWDSRTAWLNIQPTSNVFDFSRLDAFVAKAQAFGTQEIVLVLGGTPRWAATRVSATDAPWMGPGSASAPRSVESWRKFVGAVASRYAGRISAYEIWNEPNSSTFWSGTQEQWAQLIVSASQEIRVADPKARILASGFLLKRSGETKSLQPWLGALFDAGCDECIDAVSVHWYPRAKTSPSVVSGAVRRIKAMAQSMGLSREVWITETNVVAGACFPAFKQREEALRLAESLRVSGARRAYWYAWTDLDPCGSLPLQSGTPAARVVAGH